MAFAQGSRSSLSYSVETTFGTAVTPTLNLPFSTHSLNMTKDRVAGTDIENDRMPRVDRHGNKQVAGDIVADLRDADYDAFLESAMLSSFGAVTTDVLEVGVAPKFFTIEDRADDINLPDGLVRRFTGMTVNSLGISIAPNQMITATYGMVGKEMTLSTDAGFTPAAADLNPPDTTPKPFDAYSGNVKIANSGSALGATTIVTGLDFTLTNGFAPTFVIGSDSAPSLEFGRAEVEGTVSMYFEDNSFIDRFVNETETALEVQVGDGTNTMTFTFPRVKINSADVGVDGPTSRIITASFIALRDDTANTNLQITRSA